MLHRITTAGAMLAACVCLAAAPLAAQGGQRMGGKMGMRPGQRGDPLLQGITLTDAQKTQIDSIHAKYRASMMAARKSHSGDRTQMRQQMQQSMEAQQKEIRGVLTADQQTVFDKNVKAVQERRAQMQQRMQSGGAGGSGGAPPSQ